MLEKREIFRPYTDLEGKRRREVEKSIQQLRWVEGFDSNRAWSFMIELGAWVIHHHEEVYREFKLDGLKKNKEGFCGGSGGDGGNNECKE